MLLIPLTSNQHIGYRVQPIIGYTDITDNDTDNRYRYQYRYDFNYIQWPQSSLAYLAAHYCGHMHREMFILAMSVVLYLPKVFPKTIIFCVGLKMCDKWKFLSCACFQVSMLWPSDNHKENITFYTNIFQRFVIKQVCIFWSQISCTFHSFKRRQLF